MKVYQIVFGSIPKIIKECMDSVKKYYSEVEVLKFQNVEKPIIESDKKRYELLLGNNDILYIDWDVYLEEKFDLEKNCVQCNYLNGIPDYSIIYSPDSKFWKELDKERKHRKISIEIYGFIRKLLRDKKVSEIKGKYNHLYYTRRKNNG